MPVEISSPFSRTRPVTRPFCTRTCFTPALVLISTPRLRAESAMALETAHAAAHESPEAAMAADAAHHVMHEDVRGAWRARSAVRADDAVGGERDFDFVGLEPLVEEVGGALG